MLIAYQGAPGAYSHIAAKDLLPKGRSQGFGDFGSVVASVARGEAELGVLPVHNSIVGEIPGALAALAAWSTVEEVNRFEQKIDHCLLALPGADLQSLRWVESHPAALAQCTRWLSANQVEPRPVDDTAGAARAIAQDRDWTRAAIAHAGVAERYGLEVIDRDLADAPDNVTSFAVIARQVAIGRVAA
jgi:prephenate dehydratase